MRKIGLFFIILGLFISLKVFAYDMREYHKLIIQSYKNENVNEMNRLSDEVIKNYPTAGFGYFFKGLALDVLGDYKAAIDNYTKSMQLMPVNSDHYQNRALAYLHDKQYDKAIDDYDKALKLNPDNKSAKEQREYAVYAKKGIIVTQTNNSVNYQSVHEPFYLVEQYMQMPENKRKEIQESVKNYSDNILPIYYIAVAEEIFSTNKNLAAFLYMAGNFRSIQDVMMCTDKSAYGAIQGFPYVAPQTSNYILSMSGKERANLLQKVLDWDVQHTGRPNPKWICYHGMEVFTNNGNVTTLPMSKYANKKKEVRESFSKTIKELQTK